MIYTIEKYNPPANKGVVKPTQYYIKDRHRVIHDLKTEDRTDRVKYLHYLFVMKMCEVTNEQLAEFKAMEL